MLDIPPTEIMQSTCWTTRMAKVWGDLPRVYEAAHRDCSPWKGIVVLYLYNSVAKQYTLAYKEIIWGCIDHPWDHVEGVHKSWFPAFPATSKRLYKHEPLMFYPDRPNSLLFVFWLKRYNSQFGCPALRLRMFLAKGHCCCCCCCCVRFVLNMLFPCSYDFLIFCSFLANRATATRPVSMMSVTVVAFNVAPAARCGLKGWRCHDGMIPKSNDGGRIDWPKIPMLAM